ncbi:hypothetical protein [Bosea sp. Tri-44]|uniref:hypothetical protein n=1 Tax=Bosea sp. Tri-44 TaxID=1972137 RepID=UPI0013E9927A|nr:hypothetical protein [Bosea sp. Tri-44]
MELLIPLLAGMALIWLVGRHVPWNAKLIIVVTLAVIVVIVLLERNGFWPEAFRRQ